MEENILKDFETFNEFSTKYLKVNNNSNYFLIKKDNNFFVTRENIDCISIVKILSNQKLFSIKSYYDVKTGELILSTKSISNLDYSNKEYLERDESVEINSLSSILNIQENEVYYLLKEDIENLVNFKESNAKTYNLKPRKYYF